MNKKLFFLSLFVLAFVAALAISLENVSAHHYGGDYYRGNYYSNSVKVYPDYSYVRTVYRDPWRSESFTVRSNTGHYGYPRTYNYYYPRTYNYYYPRYGYSDYRYSNRLSYYFDHGYDRPIYVTSYQRRYY